MKKKLNMRNVLLINPELQKSVIFFSCLSGVISAFIIYVSILVIFYNFKKNGIEMGLAEDNIFFKYIDQQKYIISIVFLTTLPFILIINVLIGLRISNRIAGPIFRMTKHIDSILELNHFKEVKFREKDFFLDLEKKFNLLVKKINENKN